MDSHAERLNRAKEAVEHLISDTSVGPEVTLESLMELQDTIELWISGLREDIKRARG